MTATIDILPIWKKGATGEEFLLECAAMARKWPERCGKLVILMEETMPNGHTKLRTYSRGATLNELIGLLTIAQHDEIDNSRSPL